MSQPNPYAPPSAEWSAPQPELPDKRPWRVEGGRLLVQNGAVLPEICIFGTQPSETNRISARTISSEFRWAWAYNFFFCLPALWVILVYDELSIMWTFAVLFALFLPWLLFKRAKVSAWSSEALVKRVAAVRRAMSAGIVICIFMLSPVESYLDRFGGGGFPVFIAVMLLVIDLVAWLHTRHHPRLLRTKEGEYELVNLSPNALARFEEVQQEREFIEAHRERKRRDDDD